MHRTNRREVSFSVVAGVLGLAVILSALGLHEAFGYDSIGPRVLPICVGIGICVSAFLMAVSSFRAGIQGEDKGEEELHINWAPVALITLGLLFMYAFVIKLGWIISATVLFTLVSLAFGSEKRLATLGIALAMSAGTYVVFTYALGVKLPAGQLLAFLH